MIQKVHAYQTTDGQHWPTIELAQAHELKLVTGIETDVGNDTSVLVNTISAIVKNKEKVMDILTMKKTSRPKARKINKKKEETAP